MMHTRLSLITYNIWNTQRWPDREAALQTFFQRFRPDIFCLQELRAETRRSLDSALPDYRRVDDSFPGWTQESNIYWNAALLEEVEHGVEDIGIYSDKYRGLFWARLRVKDTGQTLFVSTAHYTHQRHSDELKTGQSPRLAQARQTAVALQRLVQFEEPGFFLGDLNDPMVPTLVMQEAGYQNCYKPLGLQPPPTWPAFAIAQTEPIEFITNQTIDWILANDQARPLAAGVPNFFEKDVSPSDHWPVQAVYELL